MIHRIAVCLVGVLFLVVSQGKSAEPEKTASDAELTAVVKTFFDASREAKWDAYAKLIDPRDLAEFKQKLQPVLRAAPVNPAAPGNGLLDLFEGGKDLKTIAGWQPEEFLARFMRGTAANTPLWQGNAGLKFQIIGIVRENADQAHAVVRVENTLVTQKVTQMQVVSLRRVAGVDWRVSLPDELRGLAQTLSATMFLPQPQTESATAVDKAQPE